MTARRVAVLGHVTRDIVRGPGGAETARPGGAAFYAAAALARLGLAVRLTTRLAARDRDLLAGLQRLGIAIVARGSAETTVFETLPADASGHRGHKDISVADPFEASDFDGISADAVVMDPLTTHDGFAALMAEVPHSRCRRATSHRRAGRPLPCHRRESGFG